MSSLLRHFGSPARLTRWFPASDEIIELKFVFCSKRT